MKSPNNTTDIPDVTIYLYRQWHMYYRKENKKNCYTKEKIFKEN